MFVEYITPDHTHACIAEPGKIVIVGKPSRPIDALFPLLNAMLPSDISYYPTRHAARTTRQL
jgi:ArsR family metal-binding transcriptional regulator